MSFSTGIYKSGLLSFFAGTSSVISLVMLQYSSYAYRESKKNTAEINNLLSKLNIETILEIKTQDEGSLDSNTPRKINN